IAIGVPVQKTDYVLAYEDYGHNGYIELLAGIYLLFGPSPYAARLLNSVVFLAGAALLFRIGRGAYGPVAAFGSVAILLFLPSLFMWSIALLKEPLYFAGMAAAVGCTVAALRRHPLLWRTGAVAGAIGPAQVVGS